MRGRKSDREHQSHSEERVQLALDLNSQDELLAEKIRTLSSYTRLSPAVPTTVYDSYWYFAAERQGMFFRRLQGESPPWTENPILQIHRFTNVYRASDRVSQYLIRNVIYKGDQSPIEVFFRILLFKVFNRIETWELVRDKIGEIVYADYSFERYDRVFTGALNSGSRIFSAAYIMPSGKSQFGHSRKHRNFLELIERMIGDEVPFRLAEAPSMKRAFEILRSYPLLGDFLAYQYLIDINYSELTDFSESEFVMPGPGAKDGIRKCFKELGGLNEIEIIKLMADRQEEELGRRNLSFRSLWGRPLQLIDCQGLFCEVDKYARLAHPNVPGRRTRIKQKYRARPDGVSYWFPPKWGINDQVRLTEGEGSAAL